MKYSEIFYSLQGEGQLIGVPSVFFRTSFCNLRCQWCDTPYASWTPENKDITVEEAVQQITQFKVKNVVITGGEPFVQGKDFVALCQQLYENGHHITVETNGTFFSQIAAHLISISPKLAHSTPTEDKRWQILHEQNRLKPNIIRKLLDHYECQLKFVITQPSDINEVEELEAQLAIPKELIILMPQGRESDEVNQRQQWLAEICKEKQYRYSPRLHLTLWGSERGC